MATAFIGYVLPCGEMSFWGATVITCLFISFSIFNRMGFWRTLCLHRERERELKGRGERERESRGKRARERGGRERARRRERERDRER